jgi:hypothetical protein
MSLDWRPAGRYMDGIRLETGPARDEHVLGGFLLASLEFSDSEMTISIGPNCPENMRHVSKL